MADPTKLIEERFDELPEDVQRAIQSADVENKLHEIGTKHRLHIDQIEKLDDETRLVMLGFVDPGDFADQIGIEVKVSPQEADAIATEISEALFVPIRESMQRFMDERVLQAQLTKEDKLTSSAVLPNPSARDIPVTMPSSAAATPAPPVAPKPAPVPASSVAAKPQLDLPAPTHEADTMLSTPTVSLPPKPSTPAPPTAPYKADPYREPPE